MRKTTVIYQWFDEHGKPILNENGPSLTIKPGMTGKETVTATAQIEEIDEDDPFEDPYNWEQPT